MVGEVGEPVPADVDLEARGWVQRSRAAPAKVPELKSMYEELGFEVCVQASKREDFEEKCGSCGDAATCSLVVVWVRRK